MFDIPSAVTAVSTVIDTTIKRIWPDATEVEKAKLQQLMNESNKEWESILGQLEINKIEAASSSLFVAGWRPCVGWVCASALAYASIIEPFARFIAQVIFGYFGLFPVIDTTITLQILLALLGFGVYRTYEKKIGVNR